MVNQHICHTRLEKLLNPFKNSLLLNIDNPMQWYYAEPMVYALNRSLTVLCHFSLQEIDIRMPEGAHSIEFGVGESSSPVEDLQDTDGILQLAEIVET